MAYEKYTIRQFENALFKDDRSVMSEEELQTVNTEYIDTAKLYETEEFNQVTYISNLNGRINTISIGIDLHRRFIIEFGFPCLEGFAIFKKFGHVLYWRGDLPKFVETLNRIEVRESKYVSEVENCIKKLIEFRKRKQSGEQPVKISRESWMKTINSLRKANYNINRDIDTVEDLAYMIKQQLDEAKAKT